MGDLAGEVAVVTGASSKIGTGIAATLGRRGVCHGANASAGDHKLPGTIGETAAEVTRRGGTGIAVQADQAAIEALFDRVRAEQQRLGPSG